MYVVDATACLGGRNAAIHDDSRRAVWPHATGTYASRDLLQGKESAPGQQKKKQGQQGQPQQPPPGQAKQQQQQQPAPIIINVISIAQV